MKINYCNNRWFFIFAASRDITLPVGATIIIATFKIHRNEEVFPNPEVFNPDNFLPEKSASRHYYAYVPFSAGPRSCVGMSLYYTYYIIAIEFEKYKNSLSIYRIPTTVLQNPDISYLLSKSMFIITDSIEPRSINYV